MRTRSQSDGSRFGSIDRSFFDSGVHIDLTPIDVIPARHDTITDDGGPHGTHYLAIDKKRVVSVEGINYTYVNYDGIKEVFSNYFPPSVANVDFISHLMPLEIDVPGSGGAWAVELLKRTNPSRPYVQLPVALGESLHDIKALPETIRTKGDNYASNLGVRFGILPLVSDVLKLTRLSEAVDKRSRELIRLNNKGGARVKRIMSDVSATSVVPADFVAGRDPELQGSVKTVTRSRIWGVARWIPDASFNTLIQGAKANRRGIRQTLLGISANKNISGYAADAWKLVPFSWLSDWYNNFGDLLAASQNDNLAHPEGVCIMQHLSTTKTFTGPMGTVTLARETKLRSYPPHLELSWSNPLLSGDQMSILSGLGHKHPRPRGAKGVAGGGSPPPVG